MHSTQVRVSFQLRFPAETCCGQPSRPQSSKNGTLVINGYKHCLHHGPRNVISYSVRFYSQNARGVRNDSETHETVLLDCTTGNPVTSVECVSLSFRTPPCVLAFITYILWTDGIAMALATEFDTSCIFFKFAICSIALLNLGETCHLKGRGMVTVWCTVLLLCCYDCESTQQHYDITLLEYVLWRHTMHEWVMHIHYQNMNRPRAIHKHHLHPLETMGHVW